MCDLSADAQEPGKFPIQCESRNLGWIYILALASIMLRDNLMDFNIKLFFTIKILKTFFLSTCLTI